MRFLTTSRLHPSRFQFYVGHLSTSLDSYSLGSLCSLNFFSNLIGYRRTIFGCVYQRNWFAHFRFGWSSEMQRRFRTAFIRAVFALRSSSLDSCSSLRFRLNTNFLHFRDLNALNKEFDIVSEEAEAVQVADERTNVVWDVLYTSYRVCLVFVI